MSARAEAALRIREAATRLLFAADLDDLTSFVTAARLAREAGVSPSTLQALHPPEAAGRHGVRTSARAAVRRALLDPSFDDDVVQAAVEAMLLDALGAVEEDRELPGMPEVLAGLADLALEGADGALADPYTQEFLVAVVASRDHDLRARVARELDAYLRAYTTLAGRLCDLTGREPVEGVTRRDLAISIMLAFDGAVLNVRLRPELGAATVHRLLMAVWTGLTRRIGDVDDLLERRAADPSGAPLSNVELAAVAAAVHRLHDRVGWGGVTLRKVGQLSGVPPGRLAQVIPDRDHLAGIAWAEVCGDLTRACVPGTPVEEVALALVDAACSHRALVQALLRAGLHQDGPPQWWSVPGRGEGPLIDALASSTDGPPPEVAAVVVDAVLLGAAHGATPAVLEEVVAGLLGGAALPGRGADRPPAQ